VCLVCVQAHVTQGMCGSQRTVYRGYFFPSTMWVPGIGFRLPGLVASAFAPWDNRAGVTLGVGNGRCSNVSSVLQATINIVLDRVGKTDPVTRGIEITVNYLGIQFDVRAMLDPGLSFLLLHPAIAWRSGFNSWTLGPFVLYKCWQLTQHICK
jgi:hypothetical protein